MNQQVAVHKAFHNAVRHMDLIENHLKRYLNVEELSAEHVRQVKEWIIRLSEIRSNAILSQLDKTDYSTYTTEKQEMLLENTKKLIERLEKIDNHLSVRHVNPDEIFGRLSSICPLWPFC